MPHIVSSMHPDLNVLQTVLAGITVKNLTDIIESSPDITARKIKKILKQKYKIDTKSEDRNFLSAQYARTACGRAKLESNTTSRTRTTHGPQAVKGTHTKTSKSVDDEGITVNHAVSTNAKDIEKSKSSTVPQSSEATWAFESDAGFKRYNSADTAVLENTFQSKTTRVALICHGMYAVDVISMTQKNVSSGRIRKVTRISKQPSILQPTSGSIGISEGKRAIEPTWRITPIAVSKDVMKYSIIGDPGSHSTRDVFEYNMAYGQFLRLVQGNRRIKVTQVDVYENQRLQARYDHTRNQLSSSGRACEELWVFHGTPAANVAAIMLNGFQAGGSGGIPILNGAAFGHGIYTAKGPDTPMSYGSGARQVILARALRGRCGRDSTGDADSWEPKGDWVVFRKGEQLLPVYVVHFHDCQSESATAQATPAPARALPRPGKAGRSRWFAVAMWCIGICAVLAAFIFLHRRQQRIEQERIEQERIELLRIEQQRIKEKWIARIFDALPILLLAAVITVTAVGASFPALSWILGSAAAAAFVAAADPASAPDLAWNLLMCGATTVLVPRLPCETWLLVVGAIYAAAADHVSLAAKLVCARLLTSVAGRPRIAAMLLTGAIAAQAVAAAAEWTPVVVFFLCGATLLARAGGFVRCRL
jgi:hypothetical protein